MKLNQNRNFCIIRTKYLLTVLFPILAILTSPNAFGAIFSTTTYPPQPTENTKISIAAYFGYPDLCWSLNGVSISQINDTIFIYCETHDVAGPNTACPTEPISFYEILEIGPLQIGNYVIKAIEVFESSREIPDTVIIPFSVIPFGGMVLNVPNEFATIQDAIDNSICGDTILIGDGIFSGEGFKNIAPAGRSIVIKSINGPSNTIIDCEGSGRFMFMNTGEDSTTIISGLTINYMQRVYVSLASPTFENCHFVNGFAGAMLLKNSNAIIRDCVFLNNSSTMWDGGAIDGFNSAPEITNCLFEGNSAESAGGAIDISGIPNDTIIIRNCTFVNNSSANGSAIRTYRDVSIEGCIFAFNTGSAPITIMEDVEAKLPEISCTNIFGNEMGDWVGAIADQENINGNFATDPLFRNIEEGNFHIEFDSPCAPPNNNCGILIGALGNDCGDFDGDGRSTILDIVFLINYKYKNGASPQFISSADPNGDTIVNILDVVYLINFIYKDGPKPNCP